jgi:hypothetical protein
MHPIIVGLIHSTLTSRFLRVLIEEGSSDRAATRSMPIDTTGLLSTVFISLDVCFPAQSEGSIPTGSKISCMVDPIVQAKPTGKVIGSINQNLIA